MKNADFILSKIMQPDIARRQIAAWRIKSDRIVFTNGCFDLLHPGHVHYLADAKDLGHRLVVGINSDTSVQRLKGEGRPVQDQASRALVVAGLYAVDAVVIFEEDTPLELIQLLEPDVLAKGGDWSKDQIVGAGFVERKGGEVHSLPFHQGHSSTAIIKRIGANFR